MIYYYSEFVSYVVSRYFESIENTFFLEIYIVVYILIKNSKLSPVTCKLLSEGSKLPSHHLYRVHFIKSRSLIFPQHFFVSHLFKRVTYSKGSK